MDKDRLLLNAAWNDYRKLLYDPSAVAVFEGPREVVNLKRDFAKAVAEIIRANKAKSKYLLRPLSEATVKTQRTGPQQTCAIAFKVDENDVPELSEKAAHHMSIYVKVMNLPK